MIHKIVKDYSIQKELGQGGMATVYLAEHNLLGNKSAFKLLNKEFVYNENIRKRFLAEARSMARMSHSNIIKVTDLIDDGEMVAFVMEYVEGETLKEYIERKIKLTDEEIQSIFAQMLDALGYVHEQNLVHRDIKPSNFMVDPKGKVKLMDFGIAKNTDVNAAEYTQTGTGMQMGTPMYMSPEQITETKSVTNQSDIYSLGVVLWQMVTGEKPYDTKTLSTFQLQMKIVQEDLPKTSTNWDSIIEKATNKVISNRFFSCNLMLDSVNAIKLNTISNSEIQISYLQNSDDIHESTSINEVTVLKDSDFEVQKMDDFKEIRINNHIWMNKNLNVDSFENGDKLFFADSKEAWLDAVFNKIPAYCYFNFSKELGVKNGYLYNWFAVADARDLAPKTWKIASNKEWDDLIIFFGGEKIAGAKLKNSLSKIWKEPNKAEFSSIKFDALPSGMIDQNGFFKNLGSNAYFWSLEQFNEKVAWNYYLLNFSSSICKTNSLKDCGFSVRCVKE